MQTLKWAVVLIPATVAIYLGGMSFAWRRALVRLGRQLFGRFLTPATLPRIVPPFVGRRERFALTSLFVAGLIAVGLVGFQAAIVTLVATYGLMFLARYVFPGPTHPYYLKQVIDDLQARLRIADHFKDGKTAAHLRSQLEMFENQLPERLADAANKQLFWQRRCAHPLIISFEMMCEGLRASERHTVDTKAIEIRQICQDVITGSGPARAECERRRMSALILKNYQAELRGDFSNSTPKAKETVLTLLASGLAYERMLGVSHPAVLNEVFPEDERSPLNTV